MGFSTVAAKQRRIEFTCSSRAHFIIASRAHIHTHRIVHEHERSFNEQNKQQSFARSRKKSHRARIHQHRRRNLLPDRVPVASVRRRKSFGRARTVSAFQLSMRARVLSTAAGGLSMKMQCRIESEYTCGLRSRACCAY